MVYMMMQITQRLKNKVPVVVHISHGVMGKDVHSDELREVYLHNYVVFMSCMLIYIDM